MLVWREPGNAERHAYGMVYIHHGRWMLFFHIHRRKKRLTETPSDTEEFCKMNVFSLRLIQFHTGKSLCRHTNRFNRSGKDVTCLVVNWLREFMSLTPLLKDFQSVEPLRVLRIIKLLAGYVLKLMRQDRLQNIVFN